MHKIQKSSFFLCFASTYILPADMGLLFCRAALPVVLLLILLTTAAAIWWCCWGLFSEAACATIAAARPLDFGLLAPLPPVPNPARAFDMRLVALLAVVLLAAAVEALTEPTTWCRFVLEIPAELSLDEFEVVWLEPRSPDDAKKRRIVRGKNETTQEQKREYLTNWYKTESKDYFSGKT